MYYKFTVALTIFQILGKKYAAFTANADQIVVEKYKTKIERQDANKDEIPFVVIGYGSLRPRPPWLSMFTASVIAQDWVITCGHCVDSVTNPYIWYGKLTEPSNDSIPSSRVLNIYLHPGYQVYHELVGQKGGEKGQGVMLIDNNISLLRVTVINLQLYGKLLTVDYKMLSLIGLPVKTVFGGTNIMETNIRGNDEKRHIQVAEGVVVACDEKIHGFNRDLLCVMPNSSSWDQATSAIDDGAPLLFNGEIIAIRNHDFRNGSTVVISYSRISLYLDWIDKTMGMN